jgi:hypothetical protein
MIPKEPPCGGRTLEQREEAANAMQRKPVPSENSTTNADEAPDAKPRIVPRQRRKPFVL